MRSGAKPDGAVLVPSSTVVLDYLNPGLSRVREVESVSITRSLPSDLPASVAGGSGFTAATGSITWAQNETVTDRDPSPWRYGHGIPQPGQSVLVGMDAGAGQHTVFIGEVDDSDGGTGQSVSSGLVDNVAAGLSRRVSISPKARWMYPAREADPYRQVGLTYVYAVDAIWRDCGYFTTPPWEYDPAVTLPLQGTAWAEYGTVQTATAAAGSPNSHVSFFQADGRLYAGDLDISVQPHARVGGPHPVTDGVQISVNVGLDHVGVARITANYGANTVELSITDTGGASARYSGGAQVVALPAVRGRRVSLLVNSEGQWQLRSSSGALSGAAQSVGGATVMQSVDVNADVNSRIAGVIVSHPNTPGRQHASLSFTQTAFITPGIISHGMLEATRSVNNEKARDVLDEIAKATLSSMWLDEDGMMRWAGAGVLRSQAPVATVTARDSLLSLNWRVSLDHVRATTSVTWDAALISRSRWPKITLWEGRSETLTVGEGLEEFIEVPSDEDWLGVHLPATYAGADTGGDERVNRGIGSVVGGAAIGVTGDPAGVWFGPTYGSASINRLGVDEYAYLMQVDSLPVAESFVTQMSPGGGGLWPQWDGYALPILRGYIKATRAKLSATAQGIYAGPANRPWLEHDGGKWISRFPGSGNRSDGDVPGRLADWIQQQVQTPQVEVTGCEIMPDPRIQLGDVINVDDPDNLGVTIRGLVTEITPAHHGPGDMSMRLSLTIIAASPTAVTLDEFKAAWAGANLNALKAEWTGQNLDALKADPLEGSPHGN